VGSCNYIQVFDNEGNEKARFSRASRYPLNKGDLIRLVTGNGGGWGNPAKRSKEKVIADIKNGYITQEQAQVLYQHG